MPSPKPKRKLPYTEPVFSGGVWKWRGVAKVAGAPRRRGSLRLTEEEAHRDAVALRKHLQQFGASGAGTIGGAFQALIRDARERGVTEISVAGNYERPAKVITTRYLDPAAALEDIDAEIVRWLVRTALENGIAPQTVKHGYLRVLNAAFEHAELPSPVPGVRKAMGYALRPTRFEGPYLTIPELGRLVRGILEWNGPKPGAMVSRQRHCDLVIILATTGIRTYEMDRLTGDSIDPGAGIIDIRESKDRSNPRKQPIAPLAMNAAKRLKAQAKPGSPLARHHMLLSMATTWRERLNLDGLRGTQSLRRSCASGLDSIGAPFAVTRDILGHAPAAGGMSSRYMRTSFEDRLHWVSRLSEEIARAAGFSIETGEGGDPSQS